MDRKTTHKHGNISLALASAAVTALMAGAISSAQGSLLVYEPFNYAAGTYSGSIPIASDLGGDFGFAANSTWGATSTTIASPGLSYTSGNTLQTSGNYLSKFTGNGNVRAIRGLSQGIGATGTLSTPTSVWGSVIMKSEGNAASGQYDQIRLINSASQAWIGIGFHNGSQNWSVQTYESGSNYPGVSSTVNTANQSLLVFQIIYGGGTDSSHYKISLWINPALSADGSLPAATINLSDIHQSNFLFDSIQILTANNSGGADVPLSVDELRIGTAAADVLPVPEPAALGLLGGAALLGWRMKKR